MEQVSRSRLASILALLLGIWTMISPAFISITGAALVSLLITGAVIIVFSLIQMGWESSMPSWIIGLAAVWLFISAFSFNISNAMTWNQVIVAIATFAAAIWDGLEINEVQRTHHTTTA